MPVGGGPDDRWHREAWDNATLTQGEPILADGTYELCGPKVQGNPEHYEAHTLVRHGADVITDCPNTFTALREYLRARDIEGVVWRHKDGRMVKIKGKDFGLRRGK